MLEVFNFLINSCIVISWINLEIKTFMSDKLAVKNSLRCI